MSLNYVKFHKVPVTSLRNLGTQLSVVRTKSYEGQGILFLGSLSFPQKFALREESLLTNIFSTDSLKILQKTKKFRNGGCGGAVQEKGGANFEAVL